MVGGKPHQPRTAVDKADRLRQGEQHMRSARGSRRRRRLKPRSEEEPRYILEQDWQRQLARVQEAGSPQLCEEAERFYHRVLPVEDCSMTRYAMSIELAENFIIELQRRQSEDLLLVLHQEELHEEQRDAELQKVSEPQERETLERLFDVERAQAADRMMDISNEHSALLQGHVDQLSLVKQGF